MSRGSTRRPYSGDLRTRHGITKSDRRNFDGATLRVPSESWPHYLERLRARAARIRRPDGGPVIDPFPFRPGKVDLLHDMPEFIRLPAIAQWHADGHLTPEQANKALTIAWKASRVQSAIPERLAVSLLRHAEFVTNIPGFTRADLPMELDLFRGAHAGGEIFGYSWTPQLSCAAGYAVVDVNAYLATMDVETLRRRSVYRTHVRRDDVLAAFEFIDGDEVEILVDPALVRGMCTEQSAYDDVITRMVTLNIVAMHRRKIGTDLEALRRVIAERNQGKATGSLTWVLDMFDENPNQWPFIPRDPSQRFIDDSVIGTGFLAS